jgi:DNA-binding SARP family transcriptional activator
VLSAGSLAAILATAPVCRKPAWIALALTQKAAVAAAVDGYNRAQESIMNEDVFNGSIRRFLKTLGVGAQREIEKAVREAVAQGRIKGDEKFTATATVTLGKLGLTHEVKGEIELE